jgi:hypothetical protein
MAATMAASGDLDRAVETFQASVELKLQASPRRDPHVTLRRLGLTLRASGREAEAHEALQHAFELWPIGADEVRRAALLEELNAPWS